MADIKINLATPLRVFVGTTEVFKVYVGTVLVFSKAITTTATPTSITVSNVAWTKTVTVVSNENWTVMKAGVATISTEYGGGNNTFTITCTENNTGTARITRVTVKGVTSLQSTIITFIQQA